jgi:hypothetical protein
MHDYDPEITVQAGIKRELSDANRILARSFEVCDDVEANYPDIVWDEGGADHVGLMRGALAETIVKVNDDFRAVKAVYNRIDAYSPMASSVRLEICEKATKQLVRLAGLLERLFEDSKKKVQTEMDWVIKNNEKEMNFYAARQAQGVHGSSTASGWS